MEDNKKKSVMGIAALVLGIISVITTLFWYITIPTGTLAIVFGAKSAKKTNSKLGKAGLVLGIIGISVFAFIYISLMLLIALSNL